MDHADPRGGPRARPHGRPRGHPCPRSPRSVLIAPIAFDLGPAIAQFEADIPRQFGSLDRRIRADSSARASVAFAASRSPFRVRVEGTEIVIETVLEYEGRGWYDPPLGPEVSAGCGGGDDPKPRLRLRIVSTPSLTPEWGLRTRTHADVARFSDEPRDQCQVTLLKIDVTGKVVGAVREEMTRRARASSIGDVARLDTRGRIESIWKKMERPIRLTDGVWLLIQPGAVQLASFSGAGDSLVAVVRLEARPKIVTGLRPEDSTLVTPLPPLRTTADADTGAELHVVLEGIFAYDAATGLMRKPLVGKVIRMAGRRVRIEDVTLRGIGSGRVALGVTFSGAVQGRIFFTGTPRLDLRDAAAHVPRPRLRRRERRPAGARPLVVAGRRGARLPAREGGDPGLGGPRGSGAPGRTRDEPRAHRRRAPGGDARLLARNGRERDARAPDRARAGRGAGAARRRPRAGEGGKAEVGMTDSGL